jgi:hypothetical protein
MSNKKLTIPGLTDLNARDALIKKLFEMAAYGDLGAIKYIFDRTDGKPIETVRAMMESGDRNVIKSLQKELFDFEEEGMDEGGTDTLGPPEETGGGTEEQRL